MKRSEYRQRSAALRAPYEVAKLIGRAGPTEANQARVMVVFEAYNARQSALFDRFCRSNGWLV